MTLSPSVPWRVLTLNPTSGLPLLLVSPHFSTSSYTLYLTDLSTLWSESLTRREICTRSLTEDTSIDPSDNDKNMAAFLKVLERAFNNKDPECCGTSIIVRGSIEEKDTGNGKGKGEEDKEDEDELTLTVTCELPVALRKKPLRWNMYLRKCPTPEITKRLILPLVEVQREKTAQAAALTRIVRQKDAIIGKILDKLEAMGIPLENIFNIITTGKKELTRQVAFDKVAELAPLNKNLLDANVRRMLVEVTDTKGLLEGTLQKAQIGSAATVMNKFNVSEKWWRSIESRTGKSQEVSIRGNRPRERVFLQDTASNSLVPPSPITEDIESSDNLDLLETLCKSPRIRRVLGARVDDENGDDDGNDDGDGTSVLIDSFFEPMMPSKKKQERKIIEESLPEKLAQQKRIGRIGGIGKGKAMEKAVAGQDVPILVDDDSEPKELTSKKKIGCIRRVDGARSSKAIPESSKAQKSHQESRNPDIKADTKGVSKETKRIGRIGQLGKGKKETAVGVEKSENLAVHGDKWVSGTDEGGSPTASESEDDAPQTREKNKVMSEDSSKDGKKNATETTNPVRKPIIKRRRF